jgi:hypothetical protein
MQEYYDFMRFLVKGSSDFWQVIRKGYRSYNVYFLTVDIFPDVVRVLHYSIDLNNYTEEELSRYVANWGYKSIAAFIDYLENKTMVKNYELRLATCIIENEPTIEPEVLFKGNLEDANGFIFNVLGNAEKSNLDPDNLKC